jgi:uncharacterized membrane protein
MYVEIRTNSRISAMPSMVQLVTKLVSPLRGGTCLEIIPLHVQTFIIHVPVTIVVSQLVEGNDRSNKKHDKPINPS